MKRNPHVNSESELYTRFLYEPVEAWVMGEALTEEI